MFFVIESDIEDVCQPGDVVMSNQLEQMIHECGFVMATAFVFISEAHEYADTLVKG